MKEKLRNYFEDMVVYKDLKESNFFKSLNLPSFLRDWLLKMFEDEEGHFDVEEITTFIHSYIPSKTDWIGIKNRIVVEGERVKILTRISVDINIKNQEVTFSIVGTIEADPFNGKLSNTTPLAEVIMDHKVGDVCTVKRVEEPYDVEILEIK